LYRLFPQQNLDILCKRLYLCARLTKNHLKNKMKKLFTYAAIAAFLSLAACGPSQAELDAEKKRKEDSARAADSIKAAEEAAKQKAYEDSVAAAAREQAIKDSLYKDSVEKASKKPGTTKPPKKKEPEKSTEGDPKVGKKKPGAK